MKAVRNSILTVVGLLTMCGVLSAAAYGASMTAGGTVRIFVIPGQAQGSGRILLTGAIGDYGTSKANKSGLGVMSLHKGTIQFDLAALIKKANRSQPILASKTSCTVVVTATAPVPLSHGTGLYKGISGTLMITETFAGYGPYYKSGPHKGQCNQSQNTNPLAQYVSVQGVGTVKFG